MILPGREEPIINPRDWIEIDNYRAPCDRALLVFWERPLQFAEEALEDARRDEKPRIPAFRGVIGSYNNKEMCVYRVYVGAPAATMALELLIAAGVNKFLVFGGCGAIHPSVRIYDIVVPTWGIREEGTSYHYLDPDIVPRPSPRLLAALSKELDIIAKRLGVRLHVGGIWTTDAIFRETRDKIRKYSSRGVLGVDMETTALMAVAMHRGVEIGIAHIVTDELYREKWVIYSDDKKAATIEKEIVNTLIDLLARLW